jgi:hypothetical protein
MEFSVQSTNVQVTKSLLQLISLEYFDSSLQQFLAQTMTLNVSDNKNLNLRRQSQSAIKSLEMQPIKAWKERFQLENGISSAKLPKIALFQKRTRKEIQKLKSFAAILKNHLDT